MLQNQLAERTMTENTNLPIFKVRAFAELAENRGIYSRSQRGNLETAWTIFLKNISALVPAPSSATIGEIRPLIDQVFRTYGSENKVSPTTVRAYQTRVKRLLDDFVEHNGGDFMAWKESLSRAAGSLATKSRRKRKVQPEIEEKPSPAASQSATGGVSHRLVLSEGREGFLLLPSQFSDEDVDPLWEQLEALKTLVKAQIGAMNRKSSNPL
jgi:hypothetical protein